MWTVRGIEALVEVDQPAWPQLRRLIDEATEVRSIPAEPHKGRETLYRLQVTARSPMGAVALHCGALLVEHGWLRILGAGTTGLDDLASINGLGDPASAEGPPGFLVVAYDVLGGIWAVNGGDLPGDPGEVCFWGPDTLSWSPVGGGYGVFLEWALAGHTADFYAELRWPDWEREVDRLNLDEGLSVFPPPWSQEGQDLGAATRKAVPLRELLAFNQDMAEQLGRANAGPVQLVVRDEDHHTRLPDLGPR